MVLSLLRVGQRLFDFAKRLHSFPLARLAPNLGIEALDFADRLKILLESLV
jgi:hypothetical protein